MRQHCHTLQHDIFGVKLLEPISINQGHREKLCKDGFRQKCDNLLVDIDIFYDFRSIIFGNARCLQFHQEREIRTQGNSLGSIIFPYVVLFLKLMELSVIFTSHKMLPHSGGFIVVLDG